MVAPGSERTVLEGVTGKEVEHGLGDGIGRPAGWGWLSKNLCGFLLIGYLDGGWSPRCVEPCTVFAFQSREPSEKSNHYKIHVSSKIYATNYSEAWSNLQRCILASEKECLRRPRKRNREDIPRVVVGEWCQDVQKLQCFRVPYLKREGSMP